MTITFEYAVQSLASVVGLGIAGVIVRSVLYLVFARRRHGASSKEVS